MITVGTDTYITVAEADELISKRFTSADVQRVAWEALSDDDKEIYLRNAAEAMESVKYIGFKYSSDQTLSFPRCYYQKIRRYIDINWVKRFSQGSCIYCQSEVPDDVKIAQAFEALENASPGTDSQLYDRLRSGVESFKIGRQSMTYGNGTYSLAGIDYLKSNKARTSIESFTNGGYKVV